MINVQPTLSLPATPVVSPLYDQHGRPLEYLRLAVTDRCNLRCFYCMPEEGIKYMPKHDLLSYEEMLRLTGLLATLGVRKVRLTGGEPFVRRDLVPFMERLAQLPGIDDISLTTNGVLTAPHVPALAHLGVKAVNLSLDTLNRTRFASITRRDEPAARDGNVLRLARRRHPGENQRRGDGRPEHRRPDSPGRPQPHAAHRCALH
ncbi:radical SAM protein [Hymenobacter humi]|uniref:Radical SAM protein n=1 Tax=Hymenobacter humi TaxID=1411620 RepID=A0ABW2U183_9BACT